MIDQIDQIKSEARENLIREIVQKNKGKVSKPSFSTVMHSLAEKEDHFSFIDQSIDFELDTYLESDLDDSFSQAFG